MQSDKRAGGTGRPGTGLLAAEPASAGGRVGGRAGHREIGGRAGSRAGGRAARGGFASSSRLAASAPLPGEHAKHALLRGIKQR